MRYSFEFKMECVEMYRHGKWPKKPRGTKSSSFHRLIRRWSASEAIHGPDILNLKGNRIWTAEEKIEAINKIKAGNSKGSVANEFGIDHALLSYWINQYKLYGYDGFMSKKKDRPPKELTTVKKKKQPESLNESEREELIRLREETEYLRTENAVLKKLRALRMEKEAALLKAKKHLQSENSKKKDSN